VAEKYVPIFFDWPEATQELNDQEKGRLIDAIVLYARGGDWQDRIKGNERYAFPMFRLQINRANNLSRQRAEAGSMGGKQNEANASKPKQNQANRSKANQTETKPLTNTNTNKNTNTNTNTTPLYPPMGEQAAVTAYAMDILPHLTPTQMQEFASYREDLPDDLIRHALDIAADNTRSWAYVKGILNRYLDEGIKTLADAEAQEAKRREQKRNGVGKAKEPNPALNYEQRTYTEKDFGDDFFVDLNKYAQEGTI